MKKMTARGIVALTCAWAAHADVVVRQNLKYGWNAAYVEVARRLPDGNRFAVKETTT